MSCIVAYGSEEVAWIKKWLNDGGTPVDFIPFGVDVDYFHPLINPVSDQYDVLSIGADVQRDYPLLLEYARRRPRESYYGCHKQRYGRKHGENAFQYKYCL